MALILYQSFNGYRYNSDSIFLYAFAKRFPIKGDVLDIGCGVGVLTLLLHKDFKKANYFAIEKQELMQKYAKKNFLVNKCNATLIGDDFLNYNFIQKFDFIISNPPFYRVDKHQSQDLSLNIARYEHHLPLQKLISKVSKLLKPRGYFIFCYDVALIDEIFYFLWLHKIKPLKVQFVHPKKVKKATIALIAARKSYKGSVEILKPFIVFDENNNYTKEAKEAFLAANTHSIKAFL